MFCSNMMWEVDELQINKAIRYVMKLKGVTLSAMGQSLRKEVTKKELVNGKNKRVGTGEWVELSGNDVSARLNYPNMTIENVIEMLGVLGYELVIQEKKSGARRSDQIVIDQTPDNE